MTKSSEFKAQKKRQKIQVNFWIIVGMIEHINVPKLEDAIKKEFNCTDDRFVKAQIELMQTESKIIVQTKVKVWIRQPSDI